MSTTFGIEWTGVRLCNSSGSGVYHTKILIKYEIMIYNWQVRLFEDTEYYL
jgi:hypothetical protein